jgi:hypothetical protein
VAPSLSLWVTDRAMPPVTATALAAHNRDDPSVGPGPQAMMACMSWQALPHGALAAAHVWPASRETLTAGMPQPRSHKMFWSMTATRFGSYGLAETVGSVPALTRTADRTRGVGVENAVGLAVGEGVASIVGSGVGVAVAAVVAEVVAVAPGGEAEALPGPATAGRRPAAAISPSVARARHVAPRTATTTHERRLRDTLGRPRG